MVMSSTGMHEVYRSVFTEMISSMVIVTTIHEMVSTNIKLFGSSIDDILSLVLSVIL